MEDLVESDCPEEQWNYDKEIVNKFVNNQRKPSLDDMVKWNNKMHSYFKEQWKVKWNDECTELEDVFDVENGIALSMVENEYGRE